MDALGVVPFERVKVYNINSGERFDTYAIEGERKSGVIGLNGAAARKGMVGDLIIIVTHGQLPADELDDYHPEIALIGEGNIVRKMLTK